MAHKGQERRRYVRVDGRFIVSYHVLNAGQRHDVSRTKNLSLGGMAFTNDRPFEKGTCLGVKIMLPTTPEPIIVTGEVVDSKELVRGLIYDIRLKFSHIDEEATMAIDAAVAMLLKGLNKDQKNSRPFDF
ncbi:MAG TPA: PilZ domain-containing protein [Patescibacteria group bacterium]|nr:PilZ domain-containing protein [Patescibacteria group bacterium]